MRKKGFSLIELIVAIAILATLAAVIVPQYRKFSTSTKEDSDLVAISLLESNIKQALMDTRLYNQAKTAVGENTLIIHYEVNSSGVLGPKEVEGIEIQDENGVSVDCTSLNDIGEKIKTYINGQMEPHKMESQKYKNAKCEYKITFPDVDLKINIATEINNI